MRYRARALSLVCTVLLSVWMTPRASAGPQAPVNPNAAILENFKKRVDEYVKLHKAEATALPRLKPTKSAAEISQHERMLAARIRAARSESRQGDIFTPVIAAEFRRLLGLSMQGARKDRVRQSLKSAEPVRIALRVNDPYPSNVPRQSTPPTVLLSLPQLPPEVRYGIVDHDLILQDVGANLIVDFIPAALP